MSDALWDAADVAAFLKVSRSWVYKRCDAKEIPHIRKGGIVRFDPAKVRAWFEEDEAGGRVISLVRGG